jgi:hypothetical protein
MASHRMAWTLSETKQLIENFDEPIQVLAELFPRHPKASIERKMTRLRKEGKIGNKSEETIKQAYKMRHNPLQETTKKRPLK